MPAPSKLHASQPWATSSITSLLTPASATQLTHGSYLSPPLWCQPIPSLPMPVKSEPPQCPTPHITSILLQHGLSGGGEGIAAPGGQGQGVAGVGQLQTSAEGNDRVEERYRWWVYCQDQKGLGLLPGWRWAYHQDRDGHIARTEVGLSPGQSWGGAMTATHLQRRRNEGNGHGSLQQRWFGCGTMRRGDVDAYTCHSAGRRCRSVPGTHKLPMCADVRPWVHG
ncbi:hypothetical protein K439DRAFT_1567946 [Ramaria rubella]|nr:hypothetical protein K439DRAFT_1567946 [Ramaria rubella]